jgi:lysophospholipase L1-like esterase
MKHLRLTTRVLSCVFIAIAVLELCVRIDDRITYGAPLVGRYSDQSLYEHDSIGKRGKPFGRYKKWKLNSMGFRGPELRAGGTRIICIGSSETFGLYEQPGSEFPRQLEKTLNKRAAADVFQVVNVAYPGETIRTSTLRVGEIAEQIKPQFAVIYSSPGNYIWLPWIRAQSNSPVENNGFEFRIAENVRTLAKSVLPQRVQAVLRRREIEREAARYKVMDRVPDENIAAYEQDVSALVDKLREHAIEPLLVTHATHFGNTFSEADYNLLIAWRKFFPMLKEEGFLDMEHRMNDAVKRVAQTKGVQLLDAADTLPSGSKYFADFSHFSDEGAQLLAEKIAERLDVLVRGGRVNTATLMNK